MYRGSAEGIDERTINVHYYYYYVFATVDHLGLISIWGARQVFI